LIDVAGNKMKLTYQIFIVNDNLSHKSELFSSDL